MTAPTARARLPAPTSRTQARGLVLRALQDGRPHSQGEITRSTRLNQATVSRVLADLRADHIVAVSTAPRAMVGRGRRPVLVALDSTHVRVLGIHLGLRQAHLGLVDLRGNLAATDVVELGRDPSAGLPLLVTRARQLVRRALSKHGRLLGVGVGVAGIADAETGTIRFGVDDASAAFPVSAALRDGLGAPALLAPNVHAMALAEARYGVGPGAPSVALLFVGRVIRLGLVAAGRVYHGSGPWEGLLGHAVLDPDGPPCACGQRGCLEVLAGDNRLEHEARLLAQALPRGLLARELATTPDPRDAIVASARAGDPGPANLLATRAHWLARAIVLVQHVLHPGQLLLTGTPALTDADQVAAIQAEIGRLSPRLTGEVGVRPAILPFPDIATIGAASLILEAYASQDARWAVAEAEAARRYDRPDSGDRIGATA